jgi:hypothetical protein
MDSHESYFKSVEGALGFERSELSCKFEMQEKMIEMVEVSIVLFMFGSLNFIKLVSLSQTIFFPFLYDSVSNIT